jgi:hypothetical protein
VPVLTDLNLGVTVVSVNVSVLTDLQKRDLEAQHLVGVLKQPDKQKAARLN